MMVAWAKELNISGGVIRGSPGIIIISGLKVSLKIFQQRLNCLYWKKKLMPMDQDSYDMGSDNFINHDSRS